MNVAALSQLARSDDWSDRAQAGHDLAALAGDPEAGALLFLLLDDHNTVVPQQTARALLIRANAASVRVFFLSNVLGTNEDAGSQCDAELQAAGLPPRLRSVLQELHHDQDQRARADARRALRLLVIR